RRLVAEVFDSRDDDTTATALFRDVGYDAVSDFLSSFTLHDGQGTLRPEQVDGWVRQVVPDAKWNVAVVGRADHVSALGTVDLGPLGEVNAINRAPLAKETEGANIKALISQHDRLVDIPRHRWADIRGKSAEDIRSDLNPEDGL